MQVDEQQVLGFSRELWSMKLGLRVAPEADPVAPVLGGPMLASGIRIGGPWTGAILLECDESIVRHAAVVLYDSEGGEPTAEDLGDALGELAALLGRKILPLLPEACTLSRPAAVEDPHAYRLGKQDLSTLNLSCEGRPLRITLLEEATAPAPAA